MNLTLALDSRTAEGLRQIAAVTGLEAEVIALAFIRDWVDIESGKTTLRQATYRLNSPLNSLAHTQKD